MGVVVVRRPALQRGFIMKSLHAPYNVTFLVLGALVALALLAATSAAAASTPVTGDQFAPGWQAHAKPLIHVGMSRVPGRDKWYVPAILPRGEYVLVKREGDKAEVINGYRFTVTTGNSNQYMYLVPGYGDVEAVPVADVLSLKPGPSIDWGN
jgi:hypothetical protein